MSDYRKFVVRPTLEYLGLWSEEAEDAVMDRIVAGPITQNIYGLTRDIVEGVLLSIEPYEGLAARVRRLATGLYAEDPQGEVDRNPVYATAIVRVSMPMKLEAK